jgi:protein-S-isoprenylcysteine O-methyltransferase Ste14
MHSRAFLDRNRREESPVSPNSTTRPLEGTSTPIAAVVLAAVCIAWVVVAHPTSLTDDDIPTWMVVHIAQLVFAPIIALGILALLRVSVVGISAPVNSTRQHRPLHGGG